ncbi:response regulator [Rugamonas sp. CCM 8940]|uniref:response regulator n=1 Tax=Rugamonas sp. CCM 8940 TaxID=2765359 RepID=UPI0018F5E4CC|nr:response regulator [Rugamonas sp. CCM 8940]MBJ7312672.1 response regulator [Rugamonas sp. CCM 8940]
MTERLPGQAQMLLVEPEALLRQTVALTARSLGMGDIREAASGAVARRLLREQAFYGAVFAIDCPDGEISCFDLSLLDQVRGGQSASAPDIPIAIMVEHATCALLKQLQTRQVHRLILKPFRARVLLDTFASFAAAPRG